MKYPNVLLGLPKWIDGFLESKDRAYPTVEERMRLVISLSRENIDHGGGPFGAGIFNMETNRLIAPGVNLVVPLCCSVAHAEMMAIMIAQKVLGHFDLGSMGLPPCELVTSSEPCAQCFGAIPWSGIQRVVCGARSVDAEAIGFDEGPRPRNWISELEARKISVVQDVLRDEAIGVLRYYGDSGKLIYNASRGRS